MADPWWHCEYGEWSKEVQAPTRGKARYSYALDLRDAWGTPVGELLKGIKVARGSDPLEPARREVAAWNAAHPVGTPVRYWTWTREGPGRESRTRSEAVVMGGHGSVWVEGQMGCIALTHVEVIDG